MTVNNKKYNFSEHCLYSIDPQIPKLILDEMLNQCKNLEFNKGFTHENVDPENRKSKVKWLNWDTWIAGIINNIMISANNDYFHYDLDHFDSGIQVTKYQPNDFYGWHVDMLPVHTKDCYTRKLSLSLLLNDDFEGGDLEVANTTDNTSYILKLKAGSVAVFPSWVKHRVKPVTSGTRYSLVAWMNGPQFK